jgi:hypothetical protein
VTPEAFDESILDIRDRRRYERRVPFISLVTHGLLNPGQVLFFRRDPDRSAQIKPNGNLTIDGFEGSIHQVGRHLMGGSPCNGWIHWFYEDECGEFHPIDELREAVRRSLRGES